MGAHGKPWAWMLTRPLRSPGCDGRKVTSTVVLAPGEHTIDQRLLENWGGRQVPVTDVAIIGMDPATTMLKIKLDSAVRVSIQSVTPSDSPIVAAEQSGLAVRPRTSTEIPNPSEFQANRTSAKSRFESSSLTDGRRQLSGRFNNRPVRLGNEEI